MGILLIAAFSSLLFFLSLQVLLFRLSFLFFASLHFSFSSLCFKFFSFHERFCFVFLTQHTYHCGQYMCTIEIIDREFVGCNCRITEGKMFFFAFCMYIQVVDISTKHVLAKRGEYASAYGAELRSAFLLSSAVQTPHCAQPKHTLW